MTRDRQNRYPWGSETPGPRLRTACTKAGARLKQVDAPGFDGIVKRVKAAVQAVRPLVDTVEIVARIGLRVHAPDERTVPGTEAADAVHEVREALAALAASTALTQSECYRAFVAAVEKLMTIAKTGTKHGITGTRAVDAGNPWQTFGA